MRFKLSDFFFVKMAEEGGAEGGQAAGGSVFGDVGGDGDGGAADGGAGSDGGDVDGGGSGNGGGDGDGHHEGETPERPEWLHEKFKTPEDLAKSYDELESKFGSFTGAPEGDYEIKIPEGIEGFQFYEHEELSVKQFQNVAREMGVNQAGMDRLMDFYVKSRVMEDAQHTANVQRESVDFVGGPEKLATMRAQAAGKLSEEQMTLLNDATSTKPNAPGAALKLVHSLLGLSSQPLGSKVPAAATVTKTQLDEWMSDPRYKTDPEWRKKVSEGFKQLYPEG